MKKNVTKILIIAAIILINIGCDQSTKYLAKKHLHKTETIQVLDNYFVLHYAENSGAFLSMFSSLPKTLRMIFLAILPLIFLMVMTYYITASKDLSPSYLLALCCIIGGGLSNITDRLSNEYVIDFMNVGIGRIRSGIFNCADLSIMAGTAIILFIVLKQKNKPANNSLPS